MMRRERLDDVPQYELPQPYAVRWYRPGDEEIWTDIWRRCERYREITPELFADEFGTDAEFLGQRQCYLLDGEGTAIGTATAWLPAEGYDSTCGRVHWVAIVPEMQGRGLSKPLMTIVLNRMRQLGYRRAVLTTESPRTVAIRLYLNLGFLPDIRSRRQLLTWREIRRRINHPALKKLDLENPPSA